MKKNVKEQYTVAGQWATPVVVDFVDSGELLMALIQAIPTAIVTVDARGVTGLTSTVHAVDHGDALRQYELTVKDVGMPDPTEAVAWVAGTPEAIAEAIRG